jgi:hypothetical protein
MIRIERKRPVVSVVLAALVAAQCGLGCSPEGPDAGGLPEAPPPAGATAATVAFTGEELAAGILFGQGPAAERLPELWQKQFKEHAADAGATSPKAVAAKIRTYADLSERAGASPETVKSLYKTADQLAASKLSAIDFQKASGQALGGDLAAKRVEAIMKIAGGRDPELFKRFADDVQSGDRVRVRAGLDRVRHAFAEVVVNDLENLPNADVTVDVETAIYAVVAVAVFAVAVAVVFIGVSDKLAQLDQDVFVDVVAKQFQAKF